MSKNIAIAALKKAKIMLAGKVRAGKKKVWMEQFDISHDFQDFEGVPKHQYVICSTPRSGSHFLGHLLYSTRMFGYPLEYFNGINIPFWQERSGDENHLPYIQRKRTSANGCFGIKLHWSHVTVFEKFLSQTPGCDWSSFTFIFLTRRNKLSQAISAVRAEQTASYISDVPEDGALIYDRALIEQKLIKTISDEASWQYFFARNDINYIHLNFEDVIAEPDATIKMIAKTLGLDGERIHVDESFVKKQQSDSTNQEWRVKFLEDAAVDDYQIRGLQAKVIK